SLSEKMSQNSTNLLQCLMQEIHNDHIERLNYLGNAELFAAWIPLVIHGWITSYLMVCVKHHMSNQNAKCKAVVMASLFFYLLVGLVVVTFISIQVMIIVFELLAVYLSCLG